MSYFEDGDTVPPPFNMIPTNKTFQKLFKCGSSGRSTQSFKVNISYVFIIYVPNSQNILFINFIQSIWTF